MPICPNCNIEVRGSFCPLCGRSVANMSTGAPAHSSQQSYQQPHQNSHRLYQQPPHKPKPKKAIAAMVLAIISLIMLIIAGSLTWWFASIDVIGERGHETVDIGAEAEFTLTEVSGEATSSIGGEPQTINMDLDDVSGDLDTVAETTGLLLLLSVVMVVVVVISVGLLITTVYTRNATMVRNYKMLKNFALIFSLIAMILVLTTPIYYMVAWPDTMDKTLDDAMEGDALSLPPGVDAKRFIEMIWDGSFMGSESFDVTFETTPDDIAVTGESSWGPGIGWILAFICFVLALITLILVKQGSDEAGSLALSGPPLSQSQYGYDPQQSQPLSYQQYPQQSSQYSQQPQQYQQKVPQQSPQQLNRIGTCINCGRSIPPNVVICQYCNYNQNRPIPPPP